MRIQSVFFFKFAVSPILEPRANKVLTEFYLIRFRRLQEQNEALQKSSGSLKEEVGKQARH